MIFASNNDVEKEKIMQRNLTRVSLLAGAAILLGACSATQHRGEVQDDSIDRVTVGTVQREITVGMSSANVAAILGAPNIVSTDAERREVWIYDKISTDVSYSRSNGLVAGLLVGADGGGVGAASKNAGAASSSQRTLTIIIKYDDVGLVRDFSYRTSSF
jgi:outer membrane protein assembly factor BamE (lipoprotein component of BamABCDE complex)